MMMMPQMATCGIVDEKRYAGPNEQQNPAHSAPGHDDDRFAPAQCADRPGAGEERDRGQQAGNGRQLADLRIARAVRQRKKRHEVGVEVQTDRREQTVHPEVTQPVDGVCAERLIG